ncbi:MAG TPA: hypothetical protein V6C97_24065 [Oculatellaceae cyanobacterium]
MPPSRIELVSLSCIRILIGDGEPDAYTCTISVNTGLFNGEIESYFFRSDLVEFQNALKRIAIPSVVKLWGYRCPEVSFKINNQIGGTAGCFAMEISVTANSDDPWPKLSFLEFDVPAEFPMTTIRKIDQILAAG